MQNGLAKPAKASSAAAPKGQCKSTTRSFQTEVIEPVLEANKTFTKHKGGYVQIAAKRLSATLVASYRSSASCVWQAAQKWQQN